MSNGNTAANRSDNESIPKSFGKLPIRRMAIVDACNLMHACATCNITLQGTSAPSSGPNALGVFTLVHSLLLSDFDVMMYVPESFMHREHIEYAFVLKFLEPLCLAFIGDQSHDDLVLLEAARTFGGFVITNDKFRDHHKDCHAMRNVIAERIVPYYVRKKSPNRNEMNTNKGRYFTGMEIVLRPATEDAVLVSPSDPNFPIVLQHRLKRSQARTAKIRQELDTMADFLQQEFCLMLHVKQPKLPYFDPDDEMLPPTYDQFRKKVFRATDSSDSDSFSDP